MGGCGSKIATKEDLFESVKKGDVEATKHQIAAGVNVNSQQDNDKKSPLHEAARIGKLELVNILIDNKANVNITDKDGVVPLQIAVSSQNADVALCRALLDAKADPTVHATSGMSVMHYAVLSSNVEVVRLIATQSGVDINEHVGGNAESPAVIHLAARSGSMPVVKYLVEEAHVRLIMGENPPGGKRVATPASFALDNNQQQVHSYLLEKMAEAEDNNKGL